MNGSKEIQTTNETGLIPINDGRMVPNNLDQLWRLSTIVLDSGLAPKQMDRVEKLVVAAAMGMEIGLSYMQSIQNIAPINGRPSIWGDAMLGLVQASGTLESIAETATGSFPADDYTAVCKAKRRGGQVYENEFSVADAKKAGLWGKQGPWQQYPKRMLKMRARAFTLRDGWSDILKGLHMAEEMIGSQDAVEMRGGNGRYVPVDDGQEPVEKPVYHTKSVKDIAPPVPDTPTPDPPQEVPEEVPAPVVDGFAIGDTAYYKLGLGIGWKRVNVMGFQGGEAIIEFAEDCEHNGKQMKGVISKKPTADLRHEIPVPLDRAEFINLKKASFTREYVEGLYERILETEDDTVLNDLQSKARAFFGDDYRVPGIPVDEKMPPEDEDDDQDQGPDEQEEQEAPAGWTGAPDDLIGDDPERTGIKKINAMINERGMDRAGVKLAMRAWGLHLKGEQPINPFDVESTKDIKLKHVQYFGKMLDDLRPQHDVMTLIQMREKQIKRFGDYVKDKMAQFANPVRVDHWYCMTPQTAARIKMNLDDWAAEILDLGRGGEEVPL